MPPVGRAIEDPSACEGLAGDVADRCFLGTTVRAWNAGVLARAGESAGGDALIVEPGVVTSARAVGKVLALGRAAGRDGRYVPEAEGARGMVALTGENPGLVYLAAGGGDAAERRASAPVVPFDADERTFDAFPLPDGPLRVADAWVLPVRHWGQLLWANLLALGPHLWASLVGVGGGAAGRLAWAAMRAGSTRPEALAAALTVRGKGARVHRSATVEGAWLGEGASVGAGAIVRGAVLGPGAVVEELAVVEGAVLGAGARVQRQALAKYVVIEAGAAHAGITQLSVLGRRSQVKNGATLMDMGLGAQVSVRVGGALRPAPHGICGVCVGDEAVIGSGVRIAPGRAIPPGLTVLVDPDGVLTRVETPEGCTRVVVRRGALEPA